MLVGLVLASTLGGCTLDLVGVEEAEGRPRGPSQAQLSVSVELERAAESPHVTRVRVQGVFTSGVDGEGRPRAAEISGWWLGDRRIEPTENGTGLVAWSLETTVQEAGDILRVIPPDVEGLGGAADMLLPLGYALEPTGSIDVAPGADLRVSVSTEVPTDLEAMPVATHWALDLPPLSLFGSGVLPPVLAIAGPLLEAVPSPATLRLRVSEVFGPSPQPHEMYGIYLSRQIRHQSPVSISHEP